MKGAFAYFPAHCHLTTTDKSSYRLFLLHCLIPKILISLCLVECVKMSKDIKSLGQVFWLHTVFARVLVCLACQLFSINIPCILWVLEHFFLYWDSLWIPHLGFVYFKNFSSESWNSLYVAVWWHVSELFPIKPSYHDWVLAELAAVKQHKQNASELKWFNFWAALLNVVLVDVSWFSRLNLV